MAKITTRSWWSRCLEGRHRCDELVDYCHLVSLMRDLELLRAAAGGEGCLDWCHIVLLVAIVT